MSLRFLSWLAATVLSLCAVAQQPPPNSLFIRDVTIIDCDGHAPAFGMSVLISGEWIAAIAPATQMKAPANAQTIDGRNKYLIPGLWNMHVHLGAYPDGKAALPKFLAEGITGVRDMGSPLDDILRLRWETRTGTILGPRMVVAGPIIQGPLPFQMPVFISVKDITAARDTVNMLQRRGVDFIKVQDAIPEDIYQAVATQARIDQMPFVGHIPPTVLPEEASDAGQRSVEHLGGRFWGVLIGMSLRESELHAEEVQMYRDILAAFERKQAPSPSHMRSALTKAIVESYSSQKADALIDRFRKNDTWQCPTLVVLHTLWLDTETKYTPEDLLWADRLLRKETDVVGMMQKAGIGLLAGTDLPADSKNGTLQDELAYLVDAGLTPLQALEAATCNAAKFLGKLKEVGSIQTGKAADLVLLNGNPLENIRNTKRIAAVISRGRLVSLNASPHP
ncbi:MAG: amidohydrolase family protein [Acidobacteriaceae bacterium]|nr:amidohydrolase family protein [Acidobacteriaceae bacterium]